MSGLSQNCGPVVSDRRAALVHVVLCPHLGPNRSFNLWANWRQYPANAFELNAAYKTWREVWKLYGPPQ